MLVLRRCAKLTGDWFSPSFDHAMLHLQHLPFLEEEPPREFDVCRCTANSSDTHLTVCLASPLLSSPLLSSPRLA